MKCTESLFIVLPENFIKVKYIQFLPTPLLKYPHLSCQYLLTFGPLVVANLDQFGFSKRQELLGGGFRDRDYCRRVGGPGWQFIELTLPRSVQTLPRPGCFKAPSHPLPKREGTLPFALDLPIFRGEPVAEEYGLELHELIQGYFPLDRVRRSVGFFNVPDSWVPSMEDDIGASPQTVSSRFFAIQQAMHVS